MEHEQYKNKLFAKKEMKHKMKNIQRNCHQLETYEIFSHVLMMINDIHLTMG